MVRIALAGYQRLRQTFVAEDMTCKHVSLILCPWTKCKYTTMRSSHAGKVFQTDHAVQFSDPADPATLLTLLGHQGLTLFCEYVVISTQLFVLFFVCII
jgi:hypothetical protein